MIKSLEVKGFQSHKSTKLNLHSGVNVIKGRSHSGKSSLVRALKWLLLNKPRGFHFKSHFLEKKHYTTVRISIDGNVVERTRNNRNNQYIIGEDQFEAMRSDIPEEVSQVTNIDNINIQNQGDAYFMFEKSSGKVAQELNKIVGLNEIDEVLSAVKSIEKDARTRVILLQDQQEQVENDLKQYRFVERARPMIKTITLLSNRKRMFESKVETLRQTIDSYNAVQIQLTLIEDSLKVEKPYLEIKQLIKEKEKVKAEFDQLTFIYNELLLVKGSQERCLSEQETAKKRRDEIIKKHQKEFCNKCGAYRDNWRKDLVDVLYKDLIMSERQKKSS